MLSYAAKTDLGYERENNEDYYLACPELCLWIMADGVGGKDGGEVASQIACNVIKQQIEQGDDLVDAINVAHQTIKHSFEQGVGKNGMATTVVVLMVHENKYQVAWVGDSRAYLWRNGTLDQLSHDQSLVQRLIDENILSVEEAMHHPRRNLVIQALGQENLERVEVETVVGALKNNDKILLCSDGLTDYVSDKKITELFMLSNDNHILVDKLVSAALAAQGKDNITVLAVNISTVGINSALHINLSAIEQAWDKFKLTRQWWWLLPCLIAGVVIGLWIS